MPVNFKVIKGKKIVNIDLNFDLKKSRLSYNF